VSDNLRRSPGRSNAALTALVLASASPRRRHLLALLGIPFTVSPSSVDETLLDAATARDFVAKAAREKSLDIAGKVEQPAIVVGADTVVCIGADVASDAAGCDLTKEGLRALGARLFAEGNVLVLGKPTGPEAAEVMLSLLSGRTHTVLTGVSVLSGMDRSQLSTATSQVRFRSLSSRDIHAYVATGESLDKAGAYALQGKGGRFVEAVEGDATNVIGLPLGLLVEMLSEHYPGITLPDSTTVSRLLDIEITCGKPNVGGKR
jgi:septum formation protein